MAKATTSKTESFTLRVPVGELADWRRRAAALSISVSELVLMRMRRGDDPAAEAADRPRVRAARKKAERDVQPRLKGAWEPPGKARMR